MSDGPADWSIREKQGVDHECPQGHCCRTDALDSRHRRASGRDRPRLWAASKGGTAPSASKQTAVIVPASKTASLVIRHQKAHCHGWSLNGDAFAADQAAQLVVGDSIKVTNNDVMPHQLVELSGPAATITTAAMDKMGAMSRVVFSKPGTYVFGTKAGEDYKKGVVTTGTTTSCG